MEYSELTSMQKIAILLSQFPDLAPKVLKYFSEEEIQEITLEIASLGEVKQIIVEKVIEEFYSYYEANKYIAQGGVEVARKILESVFPKEKVEEILMK
ncbi:MAG: hypothetical protein N2Z60_09930, partial [Elusimicrobiales bacterium]|nr:hypothetical protein [Elusimicrobiales bacterium]